jgi:O-antigen/teichoic acid export membrane protein
VGILFVPVYIRLIGAESYGLMTFYGTLVGTLTLLDLGLSIAISRQVSILRANTGKEKEIQDLVFSVEVIYWGIGILLGLLVILFSNEIAVHWVKSEQLSVEVIRDAVMLMGGTFIMLFPSSIYNGIMIANEEQALNSSMAILFSLLKSLGAIFVLEYINASIFSFFIWQSVVTLMYTLFLRFFVWKRVSVKGVKALFSITQLRTIWRFAIGMTALSLITFFLLQADKVVVSKNVLLKYVGYYGIAWLLASSLNQIVTALQPVVFPQLTSLEAQNKEQELNALYHKISRWVAIIIFPIGFILIFFAKEILLIWTRDITIAEYTAPMLRVMVCGSMCNCIVWVSYLYVLAKGNTMFTLIQNLVMSAIIIPLLIWLTSQYGAYGASYTWLITNGCYVLIWNPIFHRYYLKGQLVQWQKRNILPPLFISFILLFFAKICQQKFFPTLNILILTALLCLVSTLYVLIIPELRHLIFRSRLIEKKSL